ncbi:MAG: hypothetical protein ACRDTX_32205 [Pseudonocardiaceae bacterium]
MFDSLHSAVGAVAGTATTMLAGPLLAAALAKLLTPSAKLSWPISRGILGRPAGPRLVGFGEIAAAVAICLLPAQSAALVALASYLALTGASYWLRGEHCACFGVANLAVVGKVHIGLNGLAAMIAAVGLAVGSSDTPTVIRCGLALLVTLGIQVIMSRRGDVVQDVVPCTERVGGLHLFVSENCPACRALEQLLTTIEPERREAVTRTLVTKKTLLPDHLRGLGVPSAVPLSAEGKPVCSPVSGIGPVKAAIDAITIRPATCHAD